MATVWLLCTRGFSRKNNGLVDRLKEQFPDIDLRNIMAASTITIFI